MTDSPTLKKWYDANTGLVALLLGVAGWYFVDSRDGAASRAATAVRLDQSSVLIDRRDRETDDLKKRISTLESHLMNAPMCKMGPGR